MYYYIAEPAITPAEKRRIEEVKTVLSQLGIAGEFAVASPARTVDEHLELAFAKNFTTIVAIGSDGLLSRVAARMLARGYDKAAIGIIPLRPDQAAWNMIGVHSLREVADILRTRLLMPIDVLEFGRGQACIARSTISLDKPTAFHLRYNGVELRGTLTDAIILPSGELRLWDKTFQRSGGLLQKLFGGSKNQSKIGETSINATRWQLATERPCSVEVAGHAIAETPLTAERREKALKLIVSRAIMSPDKETHTSKES